MSAMAGVSQLRTLRRVWGQLGVGGGDGAVCGGWDVGRLPLSRLWSGSGLSGEAGSGGSANQVTQQKVNAHKARAERGFRDMKSELLLGPVFHRFEHRIRAHVLICWLALLLTRVAERGCEQRWPRINRELSRLSQVTLAGPAGTVVHTTPQRAI
ncbi:hypothetical protein [Nonomuraea sp. NPDC049141]|uniref:hypothetical protein n=1 Tax=Nonomuraea sp. NPDC049141 TaxID=3155500 RepID=UPI0033C4F133